jgi:hypothetical protein
VARAKPLAITEELTDVWRLIVGYAKQETVAPLRGLLAFMRFGVMGMTALAIGTGFAALAIVRALQAETTLGDGNWSFVPYVASLVGCAVVLGLAIRSVVKTPWKAKAKGDGK